MKKMKLTEADYLAIELKDKNYINGKGAALYKEDAFDKSVEYYRLASAMGDAQATSNLGYCYLYGRSIKPNTDLAIAYFKIAAIKGNVEASYKLGDIYSSDKWKVKDKELSIYYYRMAMSFMIDGEWTIYGIRYCDELDNHPSLCFALGRELFSGEYMCKDLEKAYEFLIKARDNYEKELANGSEFYKQCYEGVLKYLDDPQFDEIKKEKSKFYERQADFSGFKDAEEDFTEDELQ